jgi:hypothetical protein
MKVQVNKIQPTGNNLPNISATVIFSDDNRESWIRYCGVKIFLKKENIKNFPLDKIENHGIEEAYTFLSRILSSRST